MVLPLLSVVIPTHNRPEYAVASIRSILSINDDGLEVVVSDTSDGDELVSAVSSINDARLIYRRAYSPLSMTDNHNVAMGLASGEYVCVIGDDDSVLPEIMRATRWAKTNDVAALAPRIVANYAWPDFRSKYLGSSHAGRAYLNREFGGIWLRDAKRSLSRALKAGVQGTDGLPKVYHGIVRKKVLDEIRERSGAYFHGASPDVSGAVSVALTCRYYAEVDFPLTLPGASRKSNTGRSALKEHCGALATDPHTKRFRNLEWPAVVPGFTSVETVWAQAAWTTLEAMKAEVGRAYNLSYVYAVCLRNHFSYRHQTFAAMKEWQRASGRSGRAVWGLVLSAGVGDSIRMAGYIVRRLARPTAANGREVFAGLQDIQVAQERISAELARRNVTFPDGTKAPR